MGLSEAAARKAVAALRGQGTPVFALPQKKLVGLPPVLELRHVQVFPEGLHFEAPEGAVLAPWDEIIFFDSARVRTEKRVRVTKVKPVTISYRGARSSFGLTRETRRELGWRELLDVVCYQPWLHLRIDKDDFRYAETGLPVHPTREANFQALVVTFKARATKAVAGPGIDLLFDGRPRTRSRASSMKAYENQIAWQAQLLFRDA